MTNGLTIIDDFLDSAHFDELSKIVLGEKFPWFYIENVSLPVEDHVTTDPLAVETAGLNHVALDRDWEVKSFTYQLLQPFFNKLKNKLGYTEDELIRVRFSMKLQKIGYTKDNYNLPHVDYYYPHDTIIFYFNDSDGDTRIFDQWFDPALGNHETAFTTQTRIPPKANRLVLFKGLQYHTASNPINSSKRVILNINVEQK
jgi:hypothetical protein